MSTSNPTMRLAVQIALYVAFAAIQRPVAAQGYGGYYRDHVAKNRGVGVSVNKYLYDRYFYNRPSVSPYLNLSRPAPPGTTAYQAYVRPEQQRRQSAAAQQASNIAARKQQGRVGGMPANRRAGQPKRQPSPYYNQWYGSPVYR
ncbi:MAG: hypothetical protein IT424_00045 [Pirellulales bacterium]|nr:hypothetical protein [Pirellulales bacterium]